MSLLSSLQTDASIAGERDSLGGGRVLDSGIYQFKVLQAFVSKADSGALALNLLLKCDAGEIRQQLWMTSGTAKGGKNYYEKDGQRNYLPGFLMANGLALLTIGKEINQLGTEEKVIKLWDSAAKAETPQKVQMVMELLDQEIYGAVFKQTVDKNAKQADGSYAPTGETREENELDKWFRVRDKMTVAEILAKAETATFYTQWVEKNAGKTRDRAKGAKAGGGAASGAPAGSGLFGGGAGKPNGAGGKPTNSLFS